MKELNIEMTNKEFDFLVINWRVIFEEMERLENDEKMKSVFKHILLLPYTLVDSRYHLIAKLVKENMNLCCRLGVYPFHAQEILRHSMDNKIRK